VFAHLHVFYASYFSIYAGVWGITVLITLTLSLSQYTTCTTIVFPIEVVGFSNPSYTLHVVERELCDDTVSLRTFLSHKVSVSVVPVNGTGQSKYHCLY